MIHAVQQQAQASAVEALVDAARNDQVRLFMTNAFDADMTRASAGNLQANLTWLAAQPVVQGVPGPGSRSAAATAERALRELLAVKVDVEYGTNLITGAKAEPLVRRADSLVELATEIVRLGG